MSQIEEWENEAAELLRTKFSRFGFVAFLDLLGFSQVAAKDDEAAIKSIFSIVKNCREAARKKLDERDASEVSCCFSDSSNYDDIDISFISDSIVLHRDLPQFALDRSNSDYKFNLAFSAFWFIRLVREIFSDLLRKELPSRAAVAYGNYFWDADTRSIMAGSALIEAHNVSESLAFPGIVCCKSLMCELKEELDEISGACSGADRIFIHDFGIPLKGYSSVRNMKGSVVVPNLSSDEIGNPLDFINRQFTSYGKSVPASFAWNLMDSEKEALYKRDMSVDVFRRLYPCSQ